MSHLPTKHVSASQLNTFAGPFGCELKYKYQYIDKLPRKPTNASLYVGTSVDTALNAGHQEKLAYALGGEFHDPEGEFLAETFLDTWRNPPDEDKYGNKVEYDLSDAPKSIENLGTAAMEDYAKVELPGITPLSVQERFEVGFADTDITLLGYLDLKQAWKHGVLLVDNKTSISKSKRWTHEGASSDLQLRLQDLAISQKEPVVARGWRGWQFLQTQYNYTEAIIEAPQDHQGTLDLLGGLLARMDEACRTGDFLPTAFLNQSWVCSQRGCDWWESCPFGKRARKAVALEAA